MLGGGDAHAARDPDLVEDAFPDELGDTCRAPPETSHTLHIEERLIDRERLDEGCERLEDRHHLSGDLLVPVEVREHDACGWAQPERLRDRHRRANAVTTGLIRRAGNDRAAVRCPDDQRQTTERGVIENLDGRVERVHVDVQDARAGVVGIGGGHDPPSAVTVSHTTILPRASDMRPGVARYWAARSRMSSRTRAASA
jgi:hypothetical protein